MTEPRVGSANCIGARSKLVATALLYAACLALLPASAATSTPIKLATFDFELEDVSAGASPGSQVPSDTEALTRVTDEVRQLLAHSGRYQLVDVGPADAAAAKAHTLRDCDGCDAAIALKLGAQQSFVGVVRRISRTEYIVRFQIRDARTGVLVCDENSDLRMGADYSWSRGATRLIRDRLLDIQDKR